MTVTDEKQERTGDRPPHLPSNVVNKPLTNLTEMQIVVLCKAAGAAFWALQQICAFIISLT